MSSLLQNSSASGARKPHCQYTALKLSDYIDHSHPPTKKRPFSTIAHQAFSHTLDLILPDSAAQNFPTTRLKYAKVHLKLADIVSGDFLETHVRGEDGEGIVLRSEQCGYTGNLYSLRRGILKLELEKATYERMGLQGHAIPTPGRTHVKQRYIVELDLRKKGKDYERLLRAAKEADGLRESLTWLLVMGSESREGSEEAREVLKDHVPEWRDIEPENVKLEGVVVPKWRVLDASDEGKDSGGEQEEDASELLEWLTLCTLSSPHIQNPTTNPPMDPYLCRYQVPVPEGKTVNLVRLRWRGLITPEFAQKVCLAALKAAGTNEWMSLNATSFGGEAYMVLVNDGVWGRVWEYRD